MGVDQLGIFYIKATFYGGIKLFFMDKRHFFGSSISAIAVYPGPLLGGDDAASFEDLADFAFAGTAIGAGIG